LQGVTLYRETEREFAKGDRVQMTAPDRERGVANRELGTIERIDTNGRMDVRWDSSRTSSFEASEHRHLDYGYAVTSHSSQGQTAGRVLVPVCILLSRRLMIDWLTCRSSGGCRISHGTTTSSVKSRTTTKIQNSSDEF
jgi:ATP-dependent exoDNAse (exonuclease V) alpha subunit